MLLHMKILYYCFDINNRIESHHMGSLNSRAGKGILRVPVYRQRGLVNYPQSIQSYDARERLKISTCGKNSLVWDIFFCDMHISCCSRDPSGIQDDRQYCRSTMK